MSSDRGAPQPPPTPADHANTDPVLYAIECSLGAANRNDYEAAKAHYAALQAQAERPAVSTGTAASWEIRAEAAEAECNERIAAELGWDGATTALQRAEAERDHARDALQKAHAALGEIASTDFSEPSDFSELGRIARAALGDKP